MSKKQTKTSRTPVPAPNPIVTPVTRAPKAITHNKSFPVQKVSRTAMVNVINKTKGRFFTATFIDKDNQSRTMNAIKSNTPASALGYITVWSVQDKGYRNLNPQTLTDVSFDKVHYKANRKPVAVKTTA